MTCLSRVLIVSIFLLALCARLTPQQAPPRPPQVPPPPAAPPHAPQVPAGQPPSPSDVVAWTANLDIAYGARFSVTGSDPYEVQAEEGYLFIESEEPQGLRVAGYCVVQAEPNWECPFEPLSAGEIRMIYSFRLRPGVDYERRGYLYEEFVVSAKSVFVLLRDSQNRERWRLLNRFQKLHDAFGSSTNARMTTIQLPRNTFVSLDDHQQEPSPALDIVHFPGPLTQETLHPRTTVITRVNPGVPAFLRWGVQKLLSVGVANLGLQWGMLSISYISPAAVLGWAAILLKRRRNKQKQVATV